jgi:hypothetical protein
MVCQTTVKIRLQMNIKEIIMRTESNTVQLLSTELANHAAAHY